MRGKVIRGIGSALVMGGAVLAVQPRASAAAQVVQSYSCLGQSANVMLVGTAKETEASETVNLTGVKYTVTNSFGLAITADHIQINVPDPNATSAPYVTGSAAAAKSPPGWTAGHGSGLFALHAGSVSLSPGATISNAILRAKYKDRGPAGTVLNFVDGTVTLDVTSPAVGPVTCAPNLPLVVFAHVRE